MRLRSLLVAASVLVSTGFVIPHNASGAAAVHDFDNLTGFDTQNAISTTTLVDWYGYSPFYEIGFYLGGENSVPQPDLSNAWLGDAFSDGWGLGALYVSLQAPCVDQSGLAEMSTDPSTAKTQGENVADNAYGKANSYSNWPSNSIIYLDMEAFDEDDTSCVDDVQHFIEGWDDESDTDGGHSGAYFSTSDAAVIHAIDNPPNDAWLAEANNEPSVYDVTGVDSSWWDDSHRLHQYTSGHESGDYDGITIDPIDDDCADGALVADSHESGSC
jgi:Domain of unknown function (DUF1906)